MTDPWNVTGRERIIFRFFFLNLEWKTDCHTFDATRRELVDLKYNNLCEPMGEVSPVGSRVIEASVLGSWFMHHKGTIGPILYSKNKL